MSPAKKALWGMTTAQLLCLAVGLWIQDILVRSSDHWFVEDAGQPASDAFLSSSGTGGTNRGNSPEGKMRATPALDAMPVVRVIMLAWIGGLQFAVAYLTFSRIQTVTSEHEKRTVEEALRREKHLSKTQNAVIFGLAKLAESRDPDTGQHLERIAVYSTRLAEALRRKSVYRDQITPAFIKLIGISSALHDIGKVGVADSILLKPGKLNDDERMRMQRHAAFGGDCIREIECQLGSSNFLQMAREIACYHHERWDGTGYHTGLASVEIPLAARIAAVADVYDALSTKRVYKQAYPHEECVAIIREEAGKHFDPEIVAAFLQLESEFRSIAERLKESAENSAGAVGTSRAEHLRMSTEEEKLLSGLAEAPQPHNDVEACST